MGLKHDELYLSEKKPSHLLQMETEMNPFDFLNNSSPESILHELAYTRVGFILKSQYETLRLEDLRAFEGTRCKGSLVKFFPDITSHDGKNYSRMALKNQTVYLADPELFNDPYDCSIPFDRTVTKKHVLCSLAKEFGLKLNEEENIVQSEELLADYLNKLDDNSLPRPKRFDGSQPIVWSHLIYYSMQLASLQRRMSAFDAGGVDAVLESRMDEVEALTHNYGVACFAASHDNQNMWAHYANGYRGFAIEYDVNRHASSSFDSLDAHTQMLLQNLWDVVYVWDRPSCTKFAQEYLTSDINADSAVEMYVRALCTKQLWWGMEGESRLILPSNNLYMQACERNVSFLPIKAVYLGYKMSMDAKREILEICASGTIPNSPEVFEMRINGETFVPEFKKVLSRFGVGS